jgi:hypothetical protein
MASRRSHTWVADKAWHLDKRVPISLILTIAFQGATILWWASGVTRDIADLKKTTDAVMADSKDRAAGVSRLVALETEIKNVKELLSGIRQDLKDAEKAREWSTRQQLNKR